MKKIKLTQNKFALVDSEYFDYINKFRWYFDASTGYARSSIKGLKVYMHRLVNKTPKGLLTDHINRNRLDNRKRNLRTVTFRLNAQNREVVGITWSKVNKKWQAQIKTNGINHFLGRFDDIKTALLARKNGEELYFK